jgi:hypothetical protein
MKHDIQQARPSRLPQPNQLVRSLQPFELNDLFGQAFSAALQKMDLMPDESDEQDDSDEFKPDVRPIRALAQTPQPQVQLDHTDEMLHQNLMSQNTTQGQFDLLLPGNQRIGVTYDMGLTQSHVMLQPATRALAKQLKPHASDLSARISRKRGQDVQIIII